MVQAESHLRATDRMAGRGYDYQPKFVTALQWILGHEHIRGRRQAVEYPDFYQDVCLYAAALIALINSQDKQPLPRSGWRAYHGVNADELGSERYRVAFAIKLETLRRTTGLSQLPPNKNHLTEPGTTIKNPYLEIIWNRPRQLGERNDLNSDRVRVGQLVTAFPTSELDRIPDRMAAYGYICQKVGTEQAIAELTDAVMARLHR